MINVGVVSPTVKLGADDSEVVGKSIGRLEKIERQKSNGEG